MSIKFTKLTKLSQIFLLATVASLFSFSAKAETTSLETQFEEAYFSHGKDAFVQGSIWGQFNTMLGFTGFPDQHILRDTKTVDNLYQEAMAKQSSMGARVVTRDVTNPYDTSLRESPSYSAIE